MPATKAKTPSAELRDLEAARDEARAELNEVKTRRREHDEQTQRLRVELGEHIATHPDEVEGVAQQPRPGTQAERLTAEIAERLASPNPFESEYGEKLETFTAADAAVQDFRIAHADALVAELQPDAVAAVAAIESAFERIANACHRYRAVAEEVRIVAVNTPGLDGSSAGYDGRVDQWLAEAGEVLASDIVLPGLRHD